MKMQRSLGQMMQISAFEKGILIINIFKKSKNKFSGKHCIQ